MYCVHVHIAQSVLSFFLLFMRRVPTLSLYHKKPSLDMGYNTKPLQKEVDHHLDLDESRL